MLRFRTRSGNLFHQLGGGLAQRRILNFHNRLEQCQSFGELGIIRASAKGKQVNYFRRQFRHNASVIETRFQGTQAQLA